MPRSYSFDHFTATKQSVGRSGSPEQAKQQYLESELSKHQSGGHGGVHYGHRFAETQEKLHERAEASHSETKAEAVPEASPPKRADPSPFLQLWEEANTATKTVLHAVREGRVATFRLIRLPLDAARLALREASQWGHRLTARG